MQRLLAYVLAMGCVGTSAVWVQRDMAVRRSASVDVQLSNDAAFRDGLYLGQLARRANSPMRPPVARWSTEKDRASFVAGYRHGYNDRNSPQ